MLRRGAALKAMVAALFAGSAALGVGCSSGGGTTGGAADSAFLAAVHGATPDVGRFRTDVQLTRLGHAACDGFRSGASYQEVADRMALLDGTPPLPSEDLGTVITAAVQAYCPQYRSEVS